MAAFIEPLNARTLVNSMNEGKTKAKKDSLIPSTQHSENVGTTQQ
eukprot:CAMPEP_0206232302 /NCGR_PEP_ID=MMETSP0047_2-20121206/11339_1 /ASSEMBLY_ACC=CAM_ASM_000192 /TAXON_ID=195065 /ORGANISM="Chroomonas mesostigmatica_cf, Strain CCMP1168" /LENGTH=44 /DNA_ID= /DNA_START= /DNA_END= /DNA_ORIENTATION=